MEHVVRAGTIQQASAAITSVVGIGLLIVGARISDAPIATVLGALFFGVLWGTLMVVFARRASFDLLVTDPADLPAAEPAHQTVCKLVAMQLVLGAVLLALMLNPLVPTLGIPAGAALGLAMVYAGAAHRIGGAEADARAKIWSTSTFAWTSTQAKARTNYLVPVNGAMSAPGRPAPRVD